MYLFCIQDERIFMFNLDPTQQEWVEKAFDRLTLTEKIGQLVCERATDMLGRKDPAKWLDKYPVGSLFVGSEIIHDGAQDSASVAECVEKFNSSGKNIPLAVCGDFEHGIGRNIQGFTHLPDLMALAATFDPQLAYEYGKIIAEEGRSIGLHWGFGPVADLNLNPQNFVTNTRCMGDNPEHAISMLRELVRGMQENGMAACPKHFPGDGTDTRNQHIVTSLNLLDEEDWERKHGKVFQALIDAGAASIMIGHLGFPGYETIDGKKGKFCPATASKKILTDLLRKEMGFEGIILSDALCMNGYISWGGYEDRIIDSFNAGMDVFLWPDTEKFIPLIIKALADGRVAEERLEESVRRVLTFKAWLGIDQAGKPMPLEKGKFEDNGKTATAIAEKSITLLRNRDNSIPLTLPEGVELLAVTIPESEKAQKPMAYFTERLASRGYQVTGCKLSEMHKHDLDKFAAVFLLCNAKPLYVEYPVNNYSLWNFMINEKIKKRIYISFGTPYFLYEIAEADNYMNVYSDSRESVDAAIKALFGEIPCHGRSPVTMKHCFAFGDGRGRK
jgi:beta-N-acetylhexosaminidase